MDCGPVLQVRLVDGFVKGPIQVSWRVVTYPTLEGLVPLGGKGRAPEGTVGVPLGTVRVPSRETRRLHPLCTHAGTQT